MHARIRSWGWLALAALLFQQVGMTAEPAKWEQGNPGLKSISALAFAPEGVLIVGDSVGAGVFAIQTPDAQAKSVKTIEFTGVNLKAAALLGVTPAEISISDIAISPAGTVYLAATRGAGNDAQPVILRLANGELQDFALANVKFQRVQLPNPPASRETGRGNPRMDAITDMVYLDGRVYVAGLSNEEFSSKLRSIPFPFDSFDDGSSVEIFHGAHGRLETNSPVRTFAALEIEGQPHLLAAYTCTPLVKIPVAALKPGAQVQGETIAELGNRNRPLDMIVYEKDGTRYILMANSSRGVMKITTADIDSIDAITEPVQGGGTAGLKYETIQDLTNVVQLDRLDDDHAVIMTMSEDGSADLTTIVLP